MNKVMIFPTDTVYGIGCLIFDLKSINKIYEIKERPQDQKLPVLISTLEMIEPYVYINEIVRIIANKFWPGGLTIILKTKDVVKETTNEDTLAIRMPNNKELLNLIDELGPIRATSLNKHHEKELNDINEIKENYKNLVDEIYEFDFSNSSNVSSTIIDLSNNEVRCVREGELKCQDIIKYLKDLIKT